MRYAFSALRDWGASETVGDKVRATWTTPCVYSILSAHTGRTNWGTSAVHTISHQCWTAFTDILWDCHRNIYALCANW